MSKWCYLNGTEAVQIGRRSGSAVYSLSNRTLLIDKTVPSHVNVYIVLWINNNIDEFTWRYHNVSLIILHQCVHKNKWTKDLIIVIKKIGKVLKSNFGEMFKELAKVKYSRWFIFKMYYIIQGTGYVKIPPLESRIWTNLSLTLFNVSM